MKIKINGKTKTVRLSGRNYSLDTVTQKHTAFESFLALVTAAGSYRPSVYLGGKSNKAQRELVFLSLEYNDWQKRHADPRRVYAADWEIKETDCALV